MTYNYHRRVSCPLCEREEMIQLHTFLARCTGCRRTLSYGFFNTLRQISDLPEAEGDHPCECGHPEMRQLPDGVYRCPSCGSEVVYPVQGECEQPEHRDQRTG